MVFTVRYEEVKRTQAPGALALGPVLRVHCSAPPVAVPSLEAERSTELMGYAHPEFEAPCLNHASGS